MASYFDCSTLYVLVPSSMKPSNNQFYLVMFCAWLCLLKINIARCFGRWLFNIFHCLFVILLCFYLYNETFSFYLIIGQLISIFMQGSFDYSTQRLSRRSKDICWLNQRFGGFCPQRRCLAWFRIAFQMHVKIIQVLFCGYPLLKELLPSIFSSVWISRDLNPIFWFMYAEIGVELLGWGRSLLKGWFISRFKYKM